MGTDDEQHDGMPGGSINYAEEDDATINRDAIPTTSLCSLNTAEVKMVYLLSSYVDRYMGEYCDNVDPEVESDASQSDDR